MTQMFIEIYVVGHDRVRHLPILYEVLLHYPPALGPA